MGLWRDREIAKEKEGKEEEEEDEDEEKNKTRADIKRCTYQALQQRLNIL